MNPDRRRNWNWNDDAGAMKMTHIPIRSVCACLALLGMALLCRGEYYPARDDIVATQKTAFAGRKPEEIARFLRHPDEFTRQAAVAALADNPETALPLVEKLLADTNPWIRAGAVDVLAEVLKRAEAEKMKQLDEIPLAQGWSEAYRRIKEEDTAEEALVLKLLNAHLSGEASDPVLSAICLLFRQARFAPDAMRPFVDLAARSPNPTTWQMALHAFFSENTNPNELMRTTLAVIDRVEPETNEEVLAVTLMLRDAVKGENGRDALPFIASHLLHKVNGSEAPVRKNFWFQVVDRELGIIENLWGEETERLPDIIPSLCRCVIRLPYGQDGKQATYKLRDRSKALLERCCPGSAPAIRAWADKEAAWLANVTDEELYRVLHCLSSSAFDATKTRQNCQASFQDLKAIADKVEAGLIIHHTGDVK